MAYSLHNVQETNKQKSAILLNRWLFSCFRLRTCGCLQTSFCFSVQLHQTESTQNLAEFSAAFSHLLFHSVVPKIASAFLVEAFSVCCPWRNNSFIQLFKGNSQLILTLFSLYAVTLLLILPASKMMID